MQERLPRWSRQDGFDVALAAALTLLVLSVLAGMSERAAGTVPAAWWLAIIHTLPVAVRRRATGIAFIVSAVAGLVYVASGFAMVGLGLATLVMVYTLAAEVPRRRSLAGLIVVEVGMVAAIVIGDTGMQIDTIVGNVLILAVAWFIGDTTRRRRDANDQEKEQTALRAVAEERMRIARELHDVVAHSMSAVTVQAGMARLVIDEDPGLAKRSLESIERAGQEAMDEMRRLLHVLRSDNGSGASRAPTPRLSDLASLIDQAREAGTSVDLAVSGIERALPPGIELAAYRVVQEALTNIRKHAPGSDAKVRIDYTPEAITVQVDSTLPPNAGAGPPGHGLAGMRERIALYEGELEAAPQSNGTFRVKARFPSNGDQP